MKIFVAMSSGVDSSVCLYKLKQQGHDVIGITLRLDNNYDNPIEKSKLLCKKLDIEHVVLDYRDDFRKEIINTFNNHVLKGITPVPCVMCNKKIKLGKLVEFCKDNNAKLATGHYAKIVLENKDGNKEYCIHKAKDKLKDQTHFLCRIEKNVLQNILFPLGNTLKSEVFRIAKENNLITINSYKESQEVCFFEDKTYAEYIKSLNFEELDGDILHIHTKKKIGTHHGLLKYTIGQRQGLGIAWKEPLYVVNKDCKNNILYVGEEKYLYSKQLKIKNINILSNDIKNVKTFDCQVCLRDKTPIIGATINIESKNTNRANVFLKNSARAITPGQICAFYDGDKLLGGGEII